MTTESYSNDAPLNDPGLDQFNRWPFSQRVADVIANRRDSSSIIVGIYGPWGSGKTTAMNYIRKELSSHAHIVSLPFNPWRFRDEAELLNQFFIELANAIEKSLANNKEKVGKLIKKYGEEISLAAESAGIPGAKMFLNLVASWLGKTPNLEDLRNRIDDALMQQHKRVVVLIDDIDRMDRREVNALFRLVKLTADFKNTAYVLAFDDVVVADALQEKYGGEGSVNGRSFLEKIIQIPLHLPAVDKVALRSFCFKGVDEALQLAEIKLTPEQEQSFVRHFIDGFDTRLRTPRKARLYGNSLAFSLPILKGEVNPVDHMLIEGIRIFYPSLYEVVRSNPDVFLKGISERERRDLERARMDPILSEAMDGLNDEDKESAKGLLTALFPRTKSIFGDNTYYDHSWDSTWANEQRISSPEYFYRYFSYAIPPGDFSDQLINDLIAPTEGKLQIDFGDNLRQLLSDNNVESLITKLRRKAPSISAQQSQELAIALCSMGSRYPDPDTYMTFSTTFSQAGILISQLVSNIQTKRDRLRFAKVVIKESESLPFALECYRWFRPTKEEKAEKGAFSDSDVNQLARALVARIRKASKKETPIFIEYSKYASWMFHIWKEIDGESVVASYLVDAIQSDPSSAIKLLKCFLGKAWSMESGLPSMPDFERDQYNYVADLIAPEVIVNAINIMYDGKINVPETYPHFGEFSGDEKLAAQFLWLHRFVTSEDEERADK